MQIDEGMPSKLTLESRHREVHAQELSAILLYTICAPWTVKGDSRGLGIPPGSILHRLNGDVNHRVLTGFESGFDPYPYLPKC